MRFALGLMLASGAAVLGTAAPGRAYRVMGGGLGLERAVPEANGQPLFRPSRAGMLAAAPLIAIAGRGLVFLVFLTRATGGFKCVGFFKSHAGTAFAAADTRRQAPLCPVPGAAGLAAAAPYFS